MVDASSGRSNVFISYSHKDTPAMERLKIHLTPYAREMGLEYWADTRIQAGSDWYEGIKQALAKAKVAVLLISADFLASEFVAKEEIPALLAAEEITKLPVILKGSAFAYIKGLGKLQAINNPAIPLLTVEEVVRENEWARIAKAIYEAAMTRGEEQVQLPTPIQPTLLPVLRFYSLLGPSSWPRAVVPAEGLAIGRDSSNGLTLEDATVSRRHITLSFQAGQWLVQRQKDGGPVFVNGQECDQAILRPYDQVVIGGVLICFELLQSLRNLGTEQEPLLVTDELVPHLTVSWVGGRFVVPLREQVITLGRAPGCGIVIPASVVGKVHAQLHRIANGYRIDNVHPQNGLLFQGLRIEQRKLEHRDRLRIAAPGTNEYALLAYAAPR